MHDEKPTGLAGMFLKTIEATNANGLAARPAARATSLAPAPAPRAPESAPEAAPAPAAAPQSRSLARSVLRTVATVDANGLRELAERRAPLPEPEQVDPNSPRGKLRSTLGRIIGRASR